MIRIYWRNQGNAVADGQVENWYKEQLKILTVDTNHDIIVTTSTMLNRLRLGVAQKDITDNVVVIWPDDSQSEINHYGRCEFFHEDYQVSINIIFDLLEEARKAYKEEEDAKNSA